MVTPTNLVNPSRGVAKNGGTRGGISWWHPLSAKIGEDQKKRSSLQNELVFSPKVCDDQKKSFLPTNQWVFGIKRKKKQTVSPQNGDNRGAPPP